MSITESTDKSRGKIATDAMCSLVHQYHSSCHIVYNAVMSKHDKSPAETTVVVAMSGGVDSSVAAALLVEQGYRCIGVMMRLWAEVGEGEGLKPIRLLQPGERSRHTRRGRQSGHPLLSAQCRAALQAEGGQLLHRGLQQRRQRPTLASSATAKPTTWQPATMPTSAALRMVKCIYWRGGVDKAKDQSYVLRVL